ncbi:MAG: ATP-binding cassette domain-containing protein [Sneathiellales bacterium]|nr:ATP-binding cassette domain-containing protein [Sneathiellales bacterium]
MELFPLTLDKAVVRVKGSQLLGPVSCRISSEGLSVIMGPNGSGKTTFLRLLHGLERCREGEIEWGDMGRREAMRSQSYVFQSPIILRRSVRDNIVYPLRLRNVARAKAEREAEKWIREVGLEERMHLDARNLSGGEKQKLSLARALITEPRLLILDEPSANLDGASTRDIERLILLAKDKGCKIIMATHDFGQARRLADDVLFFHHGTILEQGNAQAFFEQPRTLEGRAFLRGDILI